MAITSTQQFIELYAIKEGVVILKNKSLRGIMMVSSINFALKSDEEQTAITYQFQNFLNSLDFSLQIFIQSRRLNMTGYLDKIKEIEQRQTNDLLRTQTAEYRKFIGEIISSGSIMNKSFYVVVPFQIVTVGGMTGQNAKNKARQTSAQAIKLDDAEQFKHAKSQLWQRMEFVALGLRRCGLQCVPLNSLELIEFFWGLHHPTESENGYYPQIPPELVQ
jgi:type IV secretory pathway VirB4 component